MNWLCGHSERSHGPTLRGHNGKGRMCRATLSRIGSQLTLALPDSMGIRERKRLLSSLSERVDAHEGIILHHGAAITLEPVQSPYSTWRRSFSSTTAELQDLEHQEESRRSFEVLLHLSYTPPASIHPRLCKKPHPLDLDWLHSGKIFSNPIVSAFHWCPLDTSGSMQILGNTWPLI